MFMIVEKAAKKKILVLTGSVILMPLTLQPSTLHPIILQTIQEQMIQR